MDGPGDNPANGTDFQNPGPTPPVSFFQGPVPSSSDPISSTDDSSSPFSSSSESPTGTIIDSSPSATQTSFVTVAYGVDSSLSATQSVNTTTPISSHVSESSNIGPIVGGVLGSLAFILLTVFALFYVRRHRRKHRIAPSSEYLASQYPYTRNPQVQHYNLISSREQLRPNMSSFPDLGTKS